MENLNINFVLGIGMVVAFILFKKWRNLRMKPLIDEYLAQNAIIVDVRSVEEFKGGHCDGSINIPLNLLEVRYSELDTNAPIIVCCASGGRSGMALNFLKSKGFEKVINAGAWTNAKP